MSSLEPLRADASRSDADPSAATSRHVVEDASSRATPKAAPPCAATMKPTAAPLFTNMISAELFEVAHTRGPLKVLPRTLGDFVIHDTRRALGDGMIAGPWWSIRDAHAELEKLWSREERPQ